MDFNWIDSIIGFVIGTVFGVSIVVITLWWAKNKGLLIFESALKSPSQVFQTYKENKQ